MSPNVKTAIDLVKDFSYVIASVTGLVTFINWINNHLATYKVQNIFVKDMATNHLPHIYMALERLCAKDGIELDEHPVIKWVDFEETQDARRNSASHT